jgi:phosphohistidine swiveling domain-containing protein
VHTLSRFAETARSPRDARIAVLIQRHVDPLAGGWVGLDSGRMTLSAVPGHPAALLRGWVAGVSVDIPLERAPTDVEVQALPIGRQTVTQLVRLTRSAADTLGATRLEWALEGDRLIVFQIGRTGRHHAATGSPVLGAPLAGVAWQRLANTLIDRRGPLAGQLVASWACGVADMEVGAHAGASPAGGVDRALALAGDLAHQASTACGLTSEQIVARLQEGDVAVAESLARASVDRSKAGELLAILEAVAVTLTATGRLPKPEAIWFQTVDWLRSAAAGRPHRPPTARPADLWTDTLYRILSAVARPARGVPAVSGLAVGRVAQITGAEPGAVPGFGSVILVNEPVATVAPLLWTASGLVARTGSPAAHLCEVARSLHLPTVVSADLPVVPDRSVVAVDGRSGQVLIGPP